MARSRRRATKVPAGQTSMSALVWSLDMSEDDYQALIVATARAFGWKVMHVRRAQVRQHGQMRWITPTSVAGWPDLTLWHSSGKVLFLEVKDMARKVTDEQQAILADFQAAHRRAKAAGVGSVVRAYVVRPDNWPQLEPMLAAA